MKELPHTFENLDHYLGNPLFAIETNVHILRRTTNFYRYDVLDSMERSVNKMKKELHKAKSNKVKWSKETPKQEGWYWIKYGTGKHIVKCPCTVVHVGKETLVTTARNMTFYEGPQHGGPGLKYTNGNKVTFVPSIRFSPMIQIPE